MFSWKLHVTIAGSREQNYNALEKRDYVEIKIMELNPSNHTLYII